MFLSDDIDAQPGLIALLPQVRDAVRSAGRGGWRYRRWARNRGGLRAGRGCGPDRHCLSAHAGGDDFAAASRRARERQRRCNAAHQPVHRPARRAASSTGSWPRSDRLPRTRRNFRFAAGAAAPLRAAAEKLGSGDFSPLWAGEAAALAREEGAEALTRRLWAEGQAVMAGLSGRGLKPSPCLRCFRIGEAERAWLARQSGSVSALKIVRQIAVTEARVASFDRLRHIRR